MKIPISSFHVGLFVLAFPCLTMSAQSSTVPKSAVQGWLQCEALKDTDHESDWSEKTFFMIMGDKTSYSAAELKSYKPAPAPGTGKTTAGWQSPSLKIRENFDDVLSAEDPSQDGKDDASDINGASFSFTRDLLNKQDTWQGKGSLIFPLIWQGSDTPDENWHLESWGLTPSVSLEKFVTQGDAKNETDSLVYRLGSFANFGGPIVDGRFENRVRGYLSYGTDTDHSVSIPALEFEWEPRYDTGSKFAIGHWRALAWRKGYDHESAKFKRHEDALLAYQWRIWTKAQAGSVEDAAGALGLTEGSFFRAGPITELKFDPFFFKRLSISARYQYLVPIDGPDVSPDRFDASIAWTLWEDVPQNRRLSIKASYVNGPLDFRDADVETLLIGFGVTF